MYSTLYKFYIYTLQIDKRNIFHRLFGTFFFYFCNVVMRNYYRFVGCANGLNRAKRDEEIIVSLTSYPKRTGFLWRRPKILRELMLTIEFFILTP